MASIGYDEWIALEKAGRRDESAFAGLDVDAEAYLGLARRGPLCRDYRRVRFWASSWQDAKERMGLGQDTLDQT